MVNMMQPCLKLINMCILSQHSSWVPQFEHVNSCFHSPNRVQMALITSDRGMAERSWQRTAWHGTLMMTALGQGGLELLEAGLLGQAWIPSRTIHNTDLHCPANMFPTRLSFLHCAATLCRHDTTVNCCSCSACPTGSNDPHARRLLCRHLTTEQFTA